MGDDQYMIMDLSILHGELEVKQKELSHLKRKIVDIESDIVGIKEAIKNKFEDKNSFVKKFGNEDNKG